VRQEPLSEAAGHLDQLADEVEKKRARSCSHDLDTLMWYFSPSMS
jgi:hypothetical protein